MGSSLLAGLVIFVILIIFFSRKNSGTEGLTSGEYGLATGTTVPSTITPVGLFNTAKRTVGTVLGINKANSTPGRNSFRMPAREGYVSPVGKVRTSPAIVVPGTHIRASTPTM